MALDDCRVLQILNASISSAVVYMDTVTTFFDGKVRVDSRSSHFALLPHNGKATV